MTHDAEQSGFYPPFRIPRLNPGMVLRLPGGSVVQLQKCVVDDWICEHTRESKSSGITVYRSRWLRRFGDRVL